jgi:ectoine hydroxylase-related dioxygenase (phytanoyl-CoA dioxygenase family)
MRKPQIPEHCTLRHFAIHGWMLVSQAFDAHAAAEMRNVVWEALRSAGIFPDEPSTWTVERPGHLQRLRSEAAFKAVGSEVVLKTIDSIFEGQAYPMPRDWGSVFAAFPSGEEWGIPFKGWHLDAHYASALWPIGGVKTLALFGEVGPRGGATQIVSGSHRLVHAWFQKHPPSPGARSADLRRQLQKHDYVRELHSPGDPAKRIARFMDEEDADGIPLRVVEIAGNAGDVFVLHPLVLHAATPNNANEPRFLLSGGITTDMWGFEALS